MDPESKLYRLPWTALLSRVGLPSLIRGCAFGALVGCLFGIRFQPDPMGPVGDFCCGFSWQGFWGGFVATPLAILEAWGRSRGPDRRPGIWFLLASYLLAAQWLGVVSFARAYPSLAFQGNPMIGVLEAYESLRSAPPVKLWFLTTVVLSLGAATSLLSDARIKTILLAHGAIAVPAVMWGKAAGGELLILFGLEIPLIMIAFYSGVLFYWPALWQTDPSAGETRAGEVAASDLRSSPCSHHP